MSDLNGAMATAVVRQWAANGVRHAALAPGSRSTPLAIALADEERIRLSVFLDERSAAFFALGAAKASGQPTVVACTSGTAAANFLPAVAEARYARVPLIACTADRPPELRDTGAGQTMDQVKLYGDAVRWFAEVDLVEGGERYWASVAARAWAEACGPPAGPVHLNLPFREPLVPVVGGSEAPVFEPQGPAHRPPTADEIDRLAGAVAATPRGLLVAGWGSGVSPATCGAFASAAGWPILADAVSGLRVGHLAISTYDALLRSAPFAAAHRPDLVLRVGAAPTGRTLAEWLDPSVPQVLVDPDGSWADPQRAAGQRLRADAEALLSGVAQRLAGGSGTQSSWLRGWRLAEEAVRHALDGLLDSWEEPFEGRAARDLVDCLPAGSNLVVGSSMPVRDLESFARPRDGLGAILSNRGVNGIDGFVSTVLGVAAGTGPRSPTVALLGDLTLLHDAGGLLGANRRALQATYVVLDNDGGGIFSFLPQARQLEPERFEALFGTPHGIDLGGVAAAYGVPCHRVTSAAELVPTVLEAVACGGVRIVVVPTDRQRNVERHREAWKVAAGAIPPASS